MALVAAVATVLLVPSVGVAQGVCDAVVVDEANIFGGRVAAVEAAAQELAQVGADIRVRTVRSFGATGNLDRFEQQLERECPSWTGADGNRKNNLVVLIVSLQEQKTGLYYGSQWDRALGNQWVRIQTDIMNPKFRDGDFAGGFVDGIREIQSLAERQVRGSVPDRLGRESPQPTPPARDSPVWVVFAAILVLSGAIGGAVLFRSYRRGRVRRLAARQKARLARQSAASRINSLTDAIQMLEIKVGAMAARVSEGDATPLREALERARVSIDQGATAYSDLSHSVGDLEIPRPGEAQYAAIEAEYQKVLDVLDAAQGLVSDLERKAQDIGQAMEQTPSLMEKARRAIEEAEKKQKLAEQGGFKTEYPAEILGRARAALEKAEACANDKEFQEAMALASEAEEIASQAARAAEELPAKRQKAEAGVMALAGRIEKTKQAVIDGRRVFDRISASYAESSCEPIKGNGTEAENRINWAIEALEAAKVAGSSESQEWHKAVEILGQANGWLDQAESFMWSISALEVNLALAQKDAPGEVGAARADITRAWDYINKYDEDIRESLEDDLRQAETKLATSEDELRKAKPDYLKACRLAREANESADKILAQARDEHETAERLRVAAASALRDARASVSRAKEYVEDHLQDVGAEAKGRLKEGEAALRDAETDSDVQARISFARKAESAGDAAYSLAYGDVRDRPRGWGEAMPPVILRGPTWGPRRGGGGRWSSGGGGLGGTWSGGGGGGSSGWGGGGGRGGGSTGW